MKIGIAQIRSGPDPRANLVLVSKIISDAESKSCDLVCFPENVFFRGPRSHFDSQYVIDIADQEIKPTSDFALELSSLIKRTSVAISFGSVPEKSSDPARPFNSQIFVGADKKITAYQKIHLFCFSGGTAVYDESLNMSFGRQPRSVRFQDFQIGLSICYDLRFPELYRELSLHQNVNLFLVPAAFTLETGKAHWHSLLRVRAIENISYVVAPGQWGSHFNDEGKELWCYGHSLAYGPWGESLAEADEQGDALLVVDIQLEEVLKRRKQLPVFDSAARSLWATGRRLIDEDPL